MERFVSINLKITMVFVLFIIPSIVIEPRLMQVEAYNYNDKLIPFVSSPCPCPSPSPSSSPSDQLLHQDFIKFVNPKEKMKKFIVEKVLKYVKVPQAIKNAASRSGNFVDCVISKFLGMLFLCGKWKVYSGLLYGGVGGICLKQFKGGKNIP